MRLGYSRKPQGSLFGFSENKEKTRNLLIALIVVLAVGGSFLYLSDKHSSGEGFIGDLWGGITAERSQKEAGNEKGDVLFGEESGETDFYREEAQAGEGMTHLARRALERHLRETGISGYSPEHRIFTEDYIQKALGSRPLLLGEEISISRDLISEAIERAELLTEDDLNNLRQYSLQVASF